MNLKDTKEKTLLGERRKEEERRFILSVDEVWVRPRGTTDVGVLGRLCFSA
jgi:hypothetical protein